MSSKGKQEPMNKTSSNLFIDPSGHDLKVSCSPPSGQGNDKFPVPIIHKPQRPYRSKSFS